MRHLSEFSCDALLMYCLFSTERLEGLGLITCLARPAVSCLTLTGLSYILLSDAPAMLCGRVKDFLMVAYLGGRGGGASWSDLTAPVVVVMVP